MEKVLVGEISLSYFLLYSVISDLGEPIKIQLTHVCARGIKRGQTSDT